MIEFNLLPTVKMDYIKAQRSRRLMFAVSGLITVLAVVLLGSMLIYSGFQKKHLGDINTDIASETSELKGKPQINKILTVQNQLQRLTELHSTKPAVSNLFAYLDDVTPSKVNIAHFTADFVNQKFSINGTTDSLSSINQYVDTLKFTTYATDGDGSKTPAFSNIVLDSYGVGTGQNGAGKTANYSVSFNYDVNIFDITKKVELKVPKITTTRAANDGSSDLFQASNTTQTGGTN